MKLYQYVSFLLCILLILIIIGCANQSHQDQNTVATINNDYHISFSELKKYVYGNLYHKMYPDISEAYNNALDVMITDQLKRIDFFERGLYKDTLLIKNINRRINEELIISYFHTQFLDKYITEEYIQKMYNNMGKEVNYRQIVLFKPENASNEQIDLLVIRTMEIKKEIEQGKDFGKLALQYSQQAESAHNDGYMPPLTWKQSITNPLYNIIYNLKVGDVRVLDTDNAYYIVNITDINKIISTLKKQYMQSSLNEFDQAFKKLIDEKSLVWYSKALNKLLEWSQDPDFYKEKYEDILQQAIRKGNNMTILTYSQGKVDFKTYLRLLDNILIPEASEYITQDDIKNFILEAVRNDIMVKKAKELNLLKDIFNSNTTNPVLQNRIVWLYNQAVIDSQIPKATPKALEQFYNANKDSLYYQLAKVNIHTIIYSDKEKANNKWEEIKQGIPFNQVTNRYLVKTFIRDRKGKIKSYLSKEPPFLGKAAFKLETDEVNGVIEYSDPEKGKQYAIIKCSHKRPEKQLTYDDVKNTIIDDFHKYYKEKIEKQTAKTLREKYKVEINHKILSKKIASAKVN